MNENRTPSISIPTNLKPQNNEHVKDNNMQSIVEYDMMAPEVPRKKNKRELRRQSALDEEDMDLCSSPPRQRKLPPREEGLGVLKSKITLNEDQQQLPPRNESLNALQLKIAGVQKRLEQIQAKVIIMDTRSHFLRHPTRLSTIYESDEDSDLQEEQ